MKSKRDINENTESSFLDDLKKSGDFKTPPNFFNDFQKEVQNKIQEKPQTWMLSNWFRYSFSGLAMVAIFVFVVLPQPNTVVEYEFSDTEYVAYLDENIDDFSEEDYIDEIEVSDLVEVENDFDLSDIELVEEDQKIVTDSMLLNENSSEPIVESIDELTNEEILEYLIEEGYEEGDWDEL